MLSKLTKIITLLIITSNISTAQIIHENYKTIYETLRIGPEPNRLINMTERGYTLLIPSDTVKPDGVVIFFQRGKITVSDEPPDSGSFDYEAFARNIAVMHVATGNPLDFFFDDTIMHWVATHIQTVLENHEMKNEPVFFAGLSLGGTRALKLAQYLDKNEDSFWLNVDAIAIVDAPLDMERFWEAETRAARDDFHEAAADEGRWVTYLLEKNLNGTPEDSYSNYVRYSPYTYSAPLGGNAQFLKDIPIRAYHEPDINWWLDNRRKTYYSMNSIDMAALIYDLKLMENEQAELVTTHQKRESFADGSSPHTWSMVDNADLIEWLVSHSK